MKLQPASRKEIRRVAIGTGILDVLMIAGFFLLSQFGIGKFELVPIVLGTLGGSVIAVVNFTILCLTVQKAVEIEDKKKMQAKFQLSYNARMVIQAGWAVIAFLVPAFHFIAGAAPVLFPKLTILYLNFTGKLMPPAEPKAEAEEAPVSIENESE